jgi:Raf kinase inhibitor-like YbhB/YbcL family protein
MAFELESSVFQHGGTIPARFTGTGEDVSPPLQWRGTPQGAQSLALIVDDPDAPHGTFTHWLLWDIPPTQNALAEGWRPGSLGKSGRTDFDKVGYGGPMPPPGHGPHRYFFRLYALDRPELGLREGASRAEVERAMEGHVLATAEWMGRFERKQDAASARR